MPKKLIPVFDENDRKTLRAAREEMVRLWQRQHDPAARQYHLYRLAQILGIDSKPAAIGAGNRPRVPEFGVR